MIKFKGPFADYLKAVAEELSIRAETLDVLAGEMVWTFWWEDKPIRECASEVIMMARRTTFRKTAEG